MFTVSQIILFTVILKFAVEIKSDSIKQFHQDYNFDPLKSRIVKFQNLSAMNGDQEMKETSASGEWKTEYRIPQSTQPIHYDVYLFPHLDTDTFDGKVAIDIEVSGTDPRDFLVVHTKFLEITKTTLVASETGKEVETVFARH